MRGKYITFDVDPKTFAVYDYAFTGAANPLDITGGRRIVAYAGKVPDHRGLTLTSGMTVELKDDGLEIERTGPGLSMKIQAKNCANGGLFQMEPERGDGTATRITHTLGADAFYYDNPNFRAREGDVVPYKDTTATVGARVNIGSDLAPKFVGRDSPQVATAGPARAAPTSSPRRAVRAAPRPSTTAAACASGTSRPAAAWAASSARTRPRSPRPPPPAPRTARPRTRSAARPSYLGFPFPVPPRTASPRASPHRGTAPIYPAACS